jgi:hypothetical protein
MTDHGTVRAVLVPPKPPVYGSTWVTLDATQSRGHDLSFHWAVFTDERSSAEIDALSGGIARFRASQPGLYVVRVSTRSGGASDSASMLVTVEPLEAHIRGPASAVMGESIELDASTSTAPEGAEFRWSAQGAQIKPTTGRVVRFLAEDGGQYLATVTVHVPISCGDGQLPAASAEHRVIVTPEREEVATAEDVYWQDEQVARHRSALSDVRSASGKWEASITGLLAAFAAVAFLAGPDSLADVASPGLARLGLTLVGAAFVLAFVARVLVADIGNAAPSFGQNVTPEEYASLSWNAAESGARSLNDARALAVGAALFVAVGSLVTAFAAVDDGSHLEPQALVSTPTGIRCGVLSTNSSGSVFVGGVLVGGGSEVALVDTCNSAQIAPTRSQTPPVWLFALAGGVTATGSYFCVLRRRYWLIFSLVSGVMVFAWVLHSLPESPWLTVELDVAWTIPAAVIGGSTAGTAIGALEQRRRRC